MLAAVIALGLVYLFPSVIFYPPELAEERQQAPGAPGAPDGAAAPGRPHATADLPTRGDSPQAALVPEAEPVPALGPLAPIPVPEVFGREGSVPGLDAPEPGAAGLRLAIPASPGGVGGMHPGALPELSDPPLTEAVPGPGIASPRMPESIGNAGTALPAPPPAAARIAGPGVPADRRAARAAAPLSTERPAVELSPGIGVFAPPAAPRVFDGSGAGSPSLTPPQ